MTHGVGLAPGAISLTILCTARGLTEAAVCATHNTLDEDESCTLGQLQSLHLSDYLTLQLLTINAGDAAPLVWMRIHPLVTWYHGSVVPALACSEGPTRARIVK